MGGFKLCYPRHGLRGLRKGRIFKNATPGSQGLAVSGTGRKKCSVHADDRTSRREQ